MLDIGPDGRSQIEKTAVMNDAPHLVINALRLGTNALQKSAGFENNINLTVCSAKEFYEKNEEDRKNCLKVDSYIGFKGLECTVVIIFDPFINWKTMNHDDLNRFVISLSRANCCTIIITTPNGKSSLEQLLDSNSSVRKQLEELKQEQEQFSREMVLIDKKVYVTLILCTR